MFKYYDYEINIGENMVNEVVKRNKIMEKVGKIAAAFAMMLLVETNYNCANTDQKPPSVVKYENKFELKVVENKADQKVYNEKSEHIKGVSKRTENKEGPGELTFKDLERIGKQPWPLPNPEGSKPLYTTKPTKNPEKVIEKILRNPGKILKE